MLRVIAEEKIVLETRRRNKPLRFILIINCCVDENIVRSRPHLDIYRWSLQHNVI